MNQDPTFLTRLLHLSYNFLSNLTLEENIYPFTDELTLEVIAILIPKTCFKTCQETSNTISFQPLIMIYVQLSGQEVLTHLNKK